ncbi:hypothetical protein H7K45_21565 [Mycobacterium yunnanensis]|uniref:DUF4393 domain-containing protein n=1 Tax=Mycobacterium yunnanensis TaxID=368477 RepID=A0A9X2Z6T5_9MYCO|nr:hypothetical protein [Mycobacterium yunnanensis]MCV7423146.1 hypothetical protein [Mycobacterium yunnanensis]
MNWIGGVLNGLADVAKSLPGGEVILAAATEAELTALRVVREHLAALDATAEEGQPAAPLEQDQPPTSTSTSTSTLRTLIDKSMYTTPKESRAELHRALLLGLLPDEARILAALSDGSAYPVIHVAEPGHRASTTFSLQYASTVGRAAGVSLPHRTPLYLRRMLALGIVSIGPELPEMRDDYEILLTDASVNAALTAARNGFRSARIQRLTVRLTDVGKELWEAAQ